MLTVALSILSLLGTLQALENGAVLVTVKEDSDAVLPCSSSSKENLESKLFDWKKDGEKRVFMYDGGLYSGRDFEDQDKQFVGRVSHFPDELKNSNASIKITKTKVSDGGTYTCIFPRLQPSQTFSIQLVVAASPEPYTKILEVTAERALLQCDVRGAFPKPVVEWRDSSRNILPAVESERPTEGDKLYIVLQTNVTKTDHYSCVVTQESISHVTSAQTYVFINGNVALLIFGSLVGGCLTGAVTLAACQFLALRKFPTRSYRVIDYLSGLKPRRDFRPQSKNYQGNGDITERGPADPTDSSKIPLNSSNGVTSSGEEV